MKVFYHSADPDGWCSAAIIKHAYPTADLYGINYGENFPWLWLNNKEEIWMADFCLEPFEEMLALNKNYKLTWIDHHISALTAYKESGINIKGLQKNGRGACELVWKYIYPDTPIPLAVDLIASYDVWDHTNPKTVPFIYGIRSNTDPSPNNKLLWDCLLFLTTPVIEEKIAKTISRGEVVLDYLQSEQYDYVKAYSFETEINGYRVIAANRGIGGKKLFDSVWDSSKYDIACTFCRLPSQKWTVSLYSDKPNVDVSKIAVKYGGGGHRGAAGMQVDELPFCY